MQDAAFKGYYDGGCAIRYAQFTEDADQIAMVALIHVIGRRSMAPNTLAHAMTHFFGDPSAIMGIIIGAIHNL